MTVLLTMPGYFPGDTEDEAKRTLDFIKTELSRYPSRGIDMESLASDIWLRAKLKGREIFKKTIRWAYIEALRSRRRRDLREGSYQPQESSPPISISIDALIEHAGLTTEEKQVLFLHFYLEKPITTIAQSSDVSPTKVYDLLHSALVKLKKEGVQWKKS